MLVKLYKYSSEVSEDLTLLQYNKEKKMKRVIWQVALVILLITSTVAAEEKMVYVNVPTVNIRTNAGTQYGVHRVVAVGYPLKVVLIQGSWYRVELKDKSIGWVHKNTVTKDMPDVTKIAQLESKLALQTTELEKTEKQLKQSIELAAKLNKQLEEIRLETKALSAQNQKLEGSERLKVAGIGIGILLLGWGLGFVTGFFKRQAEDKRFVKMMVEANALKK